MDWSYPTQEMLAQDPSGIDRILGRLSEEMDGEPIHGTRFVSSAREMLEATREIEDAAIPGSTLAVGFQTFEKFRREIGRYRALVERGVHVTAFAQMLGARDGVGRELFGMRWIGIEPQRRALQNQWFLITDGPEPLAFVGYDISAPEHIAEGGIMHPARRFTGFVTDDRRVVDALLRELERVAGADPAPEIDPGLIRVAKDAGITTILCATDEDSAAYRRTRSSATELARRLEASLLLYDRTAESLLTDPYPYPDVIGPGSRLTRLDAVKLGRSYLADQIDEGTASGVDTAAWLPRASGPKGMAEAIERFSPDLIVVPAALSRPRLIDRIRGNTLERFREMTSVPVLTVDADGQLAGEPRRAAV